MTITNRREETDDLCTSTIASGLSGASSKEANIPALSICSSNTAASDCGAEASAIIQAGTGSAHWWCIKPKASPTLALAAGGSDRDLWHQMTLELIQSVAVMRAGS